jgi:hypothetical protein
MFGVGVGVRVGGFTPVSSGGGGFDADYQAVLNYATTQGYTLPSASQQLLQNQLVVDLKNGGIWSKLDTFGVFATDGDSDFALIDWIRLTDYTAVNSPTFTTDEGFSGDAASSYIDINYNALTNGVNFTQDSASFGFYQYSARTIINVSNNNFGVGIGDTAWIRPAIPPRLHINNTAIVSDASYIYDNIQFSHLDRDSSTSINMLVDGVSLGAKFPASVALTTNPFFVFKNSATNYTNSGLSIIFTGGSLLTESLDFYNAIDTYLTSI